MMNGVKIVLAGLVLMATSCRKIEPVNLSPITPSGTVLKTNDFEGNTDPDCFIYQYTEGELKSGRVLGLPFGAKRYVALLSFDWKEGDKLLKILATKGNASYGQYFSDTLIIEQILSSFSIADTEDLRELVSDTPQKIKTQRLAKAYVSVCNEPKWIIVKINPASLMSKLHLRIRAPYLASIHVITFSLESTYLEVR